MKKPHGFAQFFAAQGYGPWSQHIIVHSAFSGTTLFRGIPLRVSGQSLQVHQRRRHVALSLSSAQMLLRHRQRRTAPSSLHAFPRQRDHHGRFFVFRQFGRLSAGHVRQVRFENKEKKTRRNRQNDAQTNRF